MTGQNKDTLGDEANYPLGLQVLTHRPYLASESPLSPLLVESRHRHRTPRRHPEKDTVPTPCDHPWDPQVHRIHPVRLVWDDMLPGPPRLHEFARDGWNEDPIRSNITREAMPQRLRGGKLNGVLPGCLVQNGKSELRGMVHTMQS